MSDEAARTSGTVVWFAEARGWGVLRDDAGRCCHVDYSQIVGDGLRSLVPGQSVAYTVCQTPRGPLALQVEPQDEPTASAREETRQAHEGGR